MSSDVCTMADCCQNKKIIPDGIAEEVTCRPTPNIAELQGIIARELQVSIELVGLISSNVTGESHTESKPMPITCLMDAMQAQCEDLNHLNKELHRIAAILGCDR